MWLVLLSVAAAADLYVPSQYATLGEAVAAASSGDTVLVDADTYAASADSGGVTISKELTVRSTVDGETVALPTLVVDAASVSLLDVSFDAAALDSVAFDGEGSAELGLYVDQGEVIWERGTLSVPEGLGILAFDSTVELVDVVLGGHIELPTVLASASTLVVSGGDADDCVATGNDGPPVIAAADTDVRVTGCSFSNNRATLEARWAQSIVDFGFASSPFAAGAALWVLGTAAVVEVEQSAFTDHAADDDGGVAYLGVTSSSWSDVTIVDATGGGFGGAMLMSSLSGVAMEVELSSVDLSEVLAVNGAIALIDAAASLSDVTVSNAAATEGGGAFYLYDATIEGEAPTLANLAADSGAFVSGRDCGIDLSGGGWIGLTSGQGAVFAQDCVVSLAGVLVEGLDVEELGGLVSASGSTVTLTELEVELTGRPEFGGLVYLDGGSLEATTLAVGGIGADYGGLVWFRDAEVSLDDLALTGPDEPAISGGVVYGDGGTLSILDTTLTDFAVEARGGMLRLFDTDVTLEEVDFIGGRADEGAAIYMDDGSLAASGLRFASGMARAGGALVADSPDAVSLTRSWFCENESDDGASSLELSEATGAVSLSNLGIVGNVDGEGSTVQLQGEVEVVLVQSSLVDNESPSAMVQVNAPLAVTNTMLVGGARGLAGTRPATGGYNLWSGQREGPVGDGYEDLPGPDAVLSAPRLVDRDAGGCAADIHLRADSPAIDAGDPDRADADGSRSDIGVYGGSEDGDYGDTGEPFSDTASPPDDSGAAAVVDRAVLRNGCASTPGGGAGWLALLIGAGRRRRLRAAPTCRSDGPPAR